MKNFLYVCMILFFVNTIASIEYNNPVKVIEGPEPIFPVTNSYDLDSDGDRDMLGYSDNDNWTLIWIEDTDGNDVPDTEHVIDALNSRIMKISVNNMDSDSLLDVVVLTEDGNLHIFPSNGSGGFLHETYSTALLQGYSCLVYDFNNDSIADIFVVGGGKASYLTRQSDQSQFSIDSLQTTLVFERGTDFMDITYHIKDINSDGYQDIVGSDISKNHLYYKLYDPVTNTFLGDNAICGLNGRNEYRFTGNSFNGNIEMLKHDYNTNEIQLWHINDVDCHIEEVLIRNAASSYAPLTFEDLNNDGLYDFVIQHDTTILDVYLSDNGSYTRSCRLNTFCWFCSFIDLDDDGDKDLSVQLPDASYSIHFFNDNGCFSYDNYDINAASSIKRIEVAEINNQKKMMLYTGNLITEYDVSGNVFTESNIPIGSIGFIKAFDSADIDGNGDLDYVVYEKTVDIEHNNDEYELVYIENGVKNAIDNFDYDYAKPEFIDVDGDGVLELVCLIRRNAQLLYVMLEYNNGFDGNNMLELKDDWASLPADFNNDSLLDLVFADSLGRYFVSFNNGDYTFSQPQQIIDNIYGNYNFIDLNSDTYVDLIIYPRSQDTDLLVHYGNSYTGFNAEPVSITLAGELRSKKFVDIDSDGDIDILYTVETFDDSLMSCEFDVCLCKQSRQDSLWENQVLTSYRGTGTGALNVYAEYVNNNDVLDIVFHQYGGNELWVMYDTSPVASDNADKTPELTTLISNYPNPFNPETKISYSLSKAGNAELTIYNIKGQKVKTLVNDHVEAGQHSIIWNGKDEQGSDVSSGVYLYRLKTADNIQNRKMLLLK